MADLRIDSSRTLGHKRNLALHYVYPSTDDEEEYEIEIAKIESQRSAWAEFMRELPSEDLNADPGLWQYWRTHANNDDMIYHATHAFSKKMAKMFNIGDKKIRKQQALKHLIRGGVPPELRGKVWYAASGAADLKREVETKDPHESYAWIIEHKLHSLTDKVREDIEKDLRRTLPPDVSRDRYSEANEELIASLRRVLYAYAIRNPCLGYCQSMNFVCMLLLFHMDEERGFWTLGALIERIMPIDYYSESMQGSLVDHMAFQRCLKELNPKLHLHLQ
jgi:hypothetical protein